MKKKQKLQRLLKVLTPDTLLPDFSVFDAEVARLKNALKDKIVVKTLDDVSTSLEKFKKSLNLQPLLDSISSLEDTFGEKITELNTLLEKKTLEMKSGDVDKLKGEILDVQGQIAFLEDSQRKEVEKLKKNIPDVKDIESRLDELTLEFSRIDALEEQEPTNWQETIDNLRLELVQRMSQIGGGSMNRQIKFNGTDFLTKYTDINYKAGANVTFTIANNNQTKMVDVTISATGGGGGGGIARSINSISADTTAASASSTDYVYLCSGTLTLTLPDATLTSNLYTVKNVGTGTVTINTTLSQTIDGSLTTIMPVRYTAVDLVSDTANWNVT